MHQLLTNLLPFNDHHKKKFSFEAQKKLNEKKSFSFMSLEGRTTMMSLLWTI